MGTFSSLRTVIFSRGVRDCIFDVYKRVWSGCRVVDISALKQKAKRYFYLDKMFGIDTVVYLNNGSVFTLQEKVRSYRYTVLGEQCGYDFTQEYMNAEGTPYEEKGEWFSLTADFYFVGWADKDNRSLKKWIIFNVPMYKQLVFEAGGLDFIGTKIQNKKHGRASFYVIPVKSLAGAVFLEGC